FPNIHVVMTAREFEALHDPNLRNIDATSLTLELPAWRDVKIFLENKSYDCSSWPPDLQNLLRTPQHLKIFLSFPRLDDGRIFSNCRSLLDHMWKLSVETTNSELENLLERIAEEMSSTEELRVPTIKFSSQRSLIEKLKSLDILLEDVRSGSISFRHQTLFEYTRARAFIKGSVSLEDFIALRQHSLFVRPQLWNALLYLQDCSKSKYQKEVKKILESTELRLHIRLLIIESLGRVTDPCEIEFRILLPFIENANFRKLIFNSLKTNVSWFNYLHQHFLSDFMKRTQGVARDALILLIASAASEPAKVLELIQTCWLTTGEYDFEILHILTAIYPWNQTAQSMSLILLQRNDVDFRFIEQFYSRDTEKTSDWSAELYLAYLIRHTQNAAKLLPLDSSTGVEIHESIREIHLDLKCPQRAALINLVHRRSPYGIQKEIDKNPESFIKLLWPWFLDILAKLAHKRERESISNEYDETGIHSRIDDKHKHCTLNVIDEAVKQFAIKDPAAFVAFCRENCSSRFKIVHRILVRALCKITVLEKNFAFEYIMADSRRLALGESYPEPDESAQLLSALIPELNEKQITEISKVMLEYCHYPLSAIKVKTTAQERKDYREWNRRHRLVLLKKLPLEFLSPELQLLKRNECRAFEPEQRKTQSDILNNDRSEGVIRIESPMCAAQMEKAQATEIAGLFKILSDKYLNRHPTNWKKGGTSQASESLRELATSMPEKAIEILGYLVPSINEYPASRALNGLYCSSLHMEQLDNTIQCLIGRGFNSGYFICAVADIVADRSDKNIKSPAWLVAFLENSLNSFNGGQDYGSDQKDQEKPGSVLWMNGPTEGWPDVCTYKLASALYRTYVSTNFEQAFNLLRSLVDRTDLTDYRHLWRHLTLREIPLLVKVDRFLAAQLIASLIAKTEGPLLCWAGVQLFAFTGHWLEEETTKQWLYSYLNKNSDWSARAFGELLTFHQAFLSRRIWAAHALNQIFEDSMFPKRESVLSGVALTLGHLWSSRNYEHRILLVNLLAQKNANIRRDLASSFANIELGKDKGTKLFLEIIIDDCDFRQSLDSVDLLENIYPVADWYPEQVYQICSLLLSEHGPSLADYSGSQFMMTGPLLDIALVLQKLSEPYKSKGLDLFEQLMLFNVPDTQQLLADLDQRIDQPLVNPKVVYRARRKRGVRT
ncbi:MAG: hypothetical protein QG574_5329, partial [Cyanobacteriota bacterium erpe_2018_sw_21hr_WHONDRS-SW48-000092_B_bin.40]|nr:hypothetical protein [Cyanobacteriota bacterium erpe_2018_sw_21hr_WHONDRS-SW48-000092_B_bin.40]